MINFKDLIVNLKESLSCDDNKNKVIFVCGGPGSGKDVIIRNILGNFNITEMDHNKIYNSLSDKDKISEEVLSNTYILINASAIELSKILYIKEELEEFNYSVMMVFVNTTNEESRRRNEKLKRSLNESVRFEKWSKSQQNKIIFNDVFENYIQFDNIGTLSTLSKEIVNIMSSVNDFLDINESKLKKTGLSRAEGPCDITPDNSAKEPQSDNIKYDAGKKLKTYTFKTYSEQTNPTLNILPVPKEPNFNQDKDKKNKKKYGNSPTITQRINVGGVGPEFDTRRQISVSAGLGDITYRESVDFKNFKNKLKESIDSPSVDMGVAGTCGGSSNKEAMDSYKDPLRNVQNEYGLKIKKKKEKKNV